MHPREDAVVKIYAGQHVASICHKIKIPTPKCSFGVKLKGGSVLKLQGIQQRTGNRKVTGVFTGGIPQRRSKKAGCFVWRSAVVQILDTKCENSIAFGSAPRREVDNQPISPRASKQAVRQIHTVWVFCQWQMRHQAAGRPFVAIQVAAEWKRSLPASVWSAARTPICPLLRRRRRRR